jgi:hypothetical protein
MVSQNCTACGTPNYISPNHFPDMLCSECNTLFVIRKQDGKNYYWVCLTCGGSVKIADIIPSWSEYFDYHGLAAGDQIQNS